MGGRGGAGLSSNTSIESDIRSVYTTLASKPGQWVDLADLRDKLTGHSRSEVDRGLAVMATQPGVELIPIENRKTLTDRQRRAAIRLGSEDDHAISIEDVE